MAVDDHDFGEGFANQEPASRAMPQAQYVLGEGAARQVTGAGLAGTDDLEILLYQSGQDIGCRQVGVAPGPAGMGGLSVDGGGQPADLLFRQRLGVTAQVDHLGYSPVLGEGWT